MTITCYRPSVNYVLEASPADYDASVEGLPSGTVTFVFTDIEGSTGLLKELGDRYDELLAGHRRIVRDTFTSLNGVEIDTQGDAFFFSFARARDAAAAAVEAQRRHAEHAWPNGERVRVRMGLHTGTPTLSDEGYTGIDIVRASRIANAGHGGQILVSNDTLCALADMPKPRNFIGMAKDLPTAEMEALLLAGIPVSDDAMRELALQRAVAVRDYLASRDLPAERLFLGAARVSSHPAGWSPRAELNLAMQ